MAASGASRAAAAAAVGGGVKARFYQIVLDMSAQYWDGAPRMNVTELLEAVYVLVNATVSVAGDINFQLVLADELGSAVVYPRSRDGGGGGGGGGGSGGGVASVGGSDRPVESIVESIRRTLAELVPLRARRAAEAEAADSGPHVASAVSRCLCFVSKRVRHLADAAMGGGIDKGAIDARILVVQGGADVARQYNAMMNAIFSAAKLGVVIDALSIGRSEPPMLQQAAFLTKGAFHHLDAKSEDPLLLLLFTVFAPDVTTRKVLRMPPLRDVDFRASCLCHQRAVDEALVCPVCLSIFCEDSDAAKTGACRVCGLNMPSETAAAAVAVRNGS